MNMPKILVVDDEDDIRDLLCYNLQFFGGYEVIQGKNGQEAVELTWREVPQLIIMDVMMPQLDGIEAARAIRADARIEKQPLIIFLTARSREFAQQATQEAGADGYLVKPIPPRALISQVKQFLTEQIL